MEDALPFNNDLNIKIVQSPKESIDPKSTIQIDNFNLEKDTNKKKFEQGSQADVDESDLQIKIDNDYNLM